MTKRLKEAGVIKSYLDDHPEATVQEIAAGVEMSLPDVVEIIGSHAVDDDGKISYAGPEAGGGWVKPPEADPGAAEG